MCDFSQRVIDVSSLMTDTEAAEEAENLVTDPIWGPLWYLFGHMKVFCNFAADNISQQDEDLYSVQRHRERDIVSVAQVPNYAGFSVV